MQEDAIALSDLEAGMPSDISKQSSKRLDLQPNDVHLLSDKSRGITALTVSIPTSETNRIDPNRPKARWRTPEFIFYGICFIIVVPYMVWVPYSLSRRECLQRTISW